MPADYVTELAQQAYREIAAGVGQEIKDVVGTPASADALAHALATRPDWQARLASLTGYTPSRWILEHELGQIDARRRNLNIEGVDPTGGPYMRAANAGLMGLCFSGGGIRSATFCLGILQGLAELNLLRCFDYLSSVSGGGYIHQWLAAWGKRRGFEDVAKQLIPLPEKDNPGAHPEPIRWLRRYSNYLTPETGLFSADTWVAITTWLRNTLLNQIILISGLFFLVLLPHLLTLRTLMPRQGPIAAAMIGGIIFLSLLASYFIGENLARFGNSKAGEKGALGQQAVQRRLVMPLMGSALLFILLLRLMSATAFTVHLGVAFAGSAMLLLVLALTIAIGGGVPLSYLKSHQRTAAYNSVSEFWREKPKCRSHVKFAIVMIAMFFLALLAAVSGAAWIVGAVRLLAKLWHVAGQSTEQWYRLALVVGPPLIVIGPLITILFMVGLLGRTFQDARREWLSRLGASLGLTILLWILFSGLSLFGLRVVIWLRHKLVAGIPVLTGWLATSLGGLLAGKSTRTSGAKSDEAPPKFGAVEVLALVGPYVFLAGLMLLISAFAEVVLRGARPAGPLWVVLVYFVPLAVCVIFAWRVDINEFSMHAFYRNRLARCYLGASNIPRNPNPFTGFDEKDTDVALSDLLPGKGYNGPFPVFCTALNLTFGEDLAWQERKAASFAFTPLYSGYDVAWTAARGTTNMRFNGFVETATYAYPRPGIHINTAAAVSGAAISPNFGYHTSPATAFLLTVFNVRLGWWLRNPRVLNEDGTRRDHADNNGADSTMKRLLDPYPWPSPHFSLLSLSNELLGRTNDTSNYVYLTDGGHFDNMGLYELVRRHCRYIVICDGEDDGNLQFEGIGMAIRKCRIDFGAEIALDLRPLQHMKDSQNSSAHCVVGTIRYPEDPGMPGIVVYIKSSLTGDEPADIVNYKRQHAAFPHDTTLNQWFTESQFESYRRLGHHVAFSVFEPGGTDPDRCVCATKAGRAGYFENLHSIWWGPTPEMDRFTAAHTVRYEALLEKARINENIPFFFDAMFNGKSDWKKGRSNEEIEYAIQFSSELIEFIWMIFNQLNLVLPEKRNHPYARGWSLIFNKWATVDVVREGWNRYKDSYSPRFQIFAQSNAVGLPEK